ncbi:heat stress transcription factor C-1a-like isoform X2 [Phragmites australis]|uniref:heat stress transcription factor C-1a-like isoform X2 n=1 Tax=Phragmites australis TaxID=29695 RepID=UPI002D76BFE6|nr:heat stress transcription factor C-1a-like isoform X2 [Phragmites australis]
MDGLHTELALGLIGCGGDHLQTAPFVAKTYQMVCEPRTDALVRWGRDNNSFLVVDPAGFSQGFRKVHPDRWEFAHESFLRGQTHLLPRIVRRKKRGEGGGASCSASGEQYGGGEDQQEGEEEREALLEEVQRLRQEQAAIGEDLAQMSRRLQATERRPDQLMSFLARLAEDPGGITDHLIEKAAEKKRRRMNLQQHRPTASPLPPAPRSPPPPLLALGSAAMNCDDWLRAEQKPEIVLPSSFDPTASCGVKQVADFAGGAGAGATGLATGDNSAVETPFPFCLLGQCFF